MAPLIWASNAAFWASIQPAFRTMQLAWQEPIEVLRARLGERPVIFVGWHAFSWLGYFIFRALPEDLRPVSVAHDGLLSRINHQAGAWTGLPTLVFSKHSATRPREQIASWLKAHPRNLLLFPDSGGPYRQAKPGVASIAQATGAAVVPFWVETRGMLEFGRTMRHCVPTPFGTVKVCFGEVVEAEDLTQQACQEALDRCGKVFDSEQGSVHK